MFCFFVSQAKDVPRRSLREDVMIPLGLPSKVLSTPPKFPFPRRAAFFQANYETQPSFFPLPKICAPTFLLQLLSKQASMGEVLIIPHDSFLENFPLSDLSSRGGSPIIPKFEPLPR